MKPIRIVGLTGQTGAGKSTVSRSLCARGIEVIDCDRLARDVVDHEKQLLADLALAFGISILNEDGTLNRRRLGAMVFADREKLDRLEAVIFPYIRAEIAERVRSLQKRGCTLVVLDAPTLFESGVDADCQEIVSVIAPENLRLNRIMVRDHLSDTEARDRMSSQHDDAFFLSHSTHVICNDKDEDNLRFLALELAAKLKEDADA